MLKNLFILIILTIGINSTALAAEKILITINLLTTLPLMQLPME